MSNIPLNLFFSFKSKTNNRIYLFNKEIKNKIKKQTDLKNKHNVLSYYLNKINSNNYKLHFKKYIAQNYIQKDNLPNITLDFFIKIISEPLFMESYLLFYKEILSSYFPLYKFDFSYFINLVQTKFLLDFTNTNPLLADLINKKLIIPKDLNSKEKANYIKSFKINNIKLIYYLIKNNIIDEKIYNEIYPILTKNENSEFLYHLIKLNNDINYIKNINIDSYDLRIKTLFNEIINQHFTNNIHKNNILPSNKIQESKQNIQSDYYKNLINNVIEEYLFMEDIEELQIFINKQILPNNLQIKFVEYSLLYGKKNNNLKDIENMLKLISPTLKKKSIKIK